MPGFWINQGSECVSGSEYAKLYRVLNVTEYVCIIHEYVWICLNMPTYALVILCLLECGVTYGLNEHEAVFLKRQNWFSL